MPPDPASESFGAWIRSGTKVETDDAPAARVELTEEQARASAAAGGADGGAHGPEPKPSFNDKVRALRYSGGGRIE
jgi:hypothetical protein